MKQWILSQLLILATNSYASGTPILKLNIEGLKSGQGGVAITLFNKVEEKNYPTKSEKAIWQKYVDLSGLTKIEISIPDLPPGEYAAFAYHDENGDKKLNTNFIGIPKEGYGASKGAKNKFGPPKFSDAKFNLEVEIPTSYNSTTIKVDY